MTEPTPEMRLEYVANFLVPVCFAECAHRDGLRCKLTKRYEEYCLPEISKNYYSWRN